MSKETFDQMLARVQAKRSSSSTPPPPPPKLSLSTPKVATATAPKK